MKKPCVVYSTTSSFHGMVTTFIGRTSRDETVRARVSQRFIVDPARVTLNIDDVFIDAPDDMKFVEACNWVINQIESLGYFVVEKGR